MTIFVPPWPQVIDPNANFPVSGGKLFFFLSGTTTDAEVFSDAALTVSLGNEVTCDSNGRPTTAIYLDPAVSYKIIATGSDGDTGSPLYPEIDAYDPNGQIRSPIEAVSGASRVYTLADAAKVFRRTHSAAMSDTLPTASSIGDGAFITIRNVSATYDDVVSVASGGTIDGLSSLTIHPGQQVTLRSTGAAWLSDPAPLTIGTRVYATPAAAWAPAATNGCAAIARAETSTNKVNYDVLAFDAASDEYAYFVTYLPPSYEAGTLKFRPLWTASGGTPGETVSWGMQALCLTDFAVLDQAYGAVAESLDTLLATGYMHLSGAAVVSPANDGADRVLMLRVKRTVANDNLSVDALLIGVELLWSLHKPNDA